jgi:hypothetical protein
MPPIAACCLLLALHLPCEIEPRPNTLTPKEISDGWILLFDGETMFGWERGGHATGFKVSVENGHLVCSGRGLAKFGTAFSPFELQFECCCAGLKGRAVATLWEGTVRKSGVATSFEVGPNWTRVKLTLSDGGYTSEIGNTPPFARDGLRGSSAVVELGHDKDADIHIRNVKLRPLNMKPLFNGKDLAGWKEFPGKESKFAAAQGAITVKDGPGDLQTVGKYKDFVLQAECITHGKHLNSGIFFRCKDGEYQNGYEAQIHNGFDEKKPKKYLIEEYDPKTNESTGKKEQLFAAIDYGTGAIYRRMPARKQMAKDGKWFTMTVVANGNHIATWVNGIQVTDWYDHRPKSDNARTGCRLEAGHISLQGHDPTTDLSFKNIRIAELSDPN